ncbi:FAD-dependent oxidoreductase [Micromonospora sp. RTGN7]|uniref:FAD-dependent oxidoreductase n=1 Tax=Micromonospora sp. RTGN7 TaxID=3016526 RepID=UPI0029FF1766|nr:FAD-dependent oxidoreductase [Micromonospora sp. RTGN7]
MLADSDTEPTDAVGAPAEDERTQVLIVGGGYAGLAAALFLSHQGVRTLLVDRHPAVSVQGRARGINQRTMELYRPYGLEPAIRAAGRPFDDEAGVVRCETLAGEWSWLLADDTRKPLPDLTACEFGMADQRAVEPLLIRAAHDRGADIRFGTRCDSVTVDADGVTAVLGTAGGSGTVRADYLIAADGFRGTIGPAHGITRAGPGITQSWVTFVIRAELSSIVTQRAMFWIVVNDRIGQGSFLTTSEPDQWAVSVSYDPAVESGADYTPQRCARLAAEVLGVDVPVEVLDVAAWEEAVEVADRYRNGRVFVVGDSAHVWPPAGAMGANAAVQDAHNLAWKLAARLRGQAEERLLDSYEDERRPVALALADITVRRQRARFGGGDPGFEDVDDVLLTLGQRYRSTAMLGVRHDGGYGADLPADAAPGTRAPHLWLDRAGERITVHDLCHDSFVLLTGAAGGAWAGAAQRCAARTGVPLLAYRIGTDLTDVEGVWESRYGCSADGAVLLRPDGYVAWRGGGPVDGRAEVLAGVLREILSGTF